MKYNKIIINISEFDTIACYKYDEVLVKEKTLYYDSANLRSYIIIKRNKIFYTTYEI